MSKLNLFLMNTLLPFQIHKVTSIEIHHLFNTLPISDTICCYWTCRSISGSKYSKS